MAIPLYSIWLAYRTYTGMTRGLTGLGRDGGNPGEAPPMSKRQQKLEKRGPSSVRDR